MKSLYESLLDDEEDMINDTSTAKEVKLKIIDFIKDHYKLFNTRFKELKIERYIKINKDLTVDIKTNTPTELRVYNNLNETMPVKNFKWGKIWNLDVNCKNSDHLENFPLSCNYLTLRKCFKLKNFNGLPSHINTLEIYNSYKIKDFKSLPNNINSFENLFIHEMTNLRSLEGLPKVSNTIDIGDCPRLDTLIEFEGLQKITCFHCPLITSDELNKTNAKIKYNI